MGAYALIILCIVNSIIGIADRRKSYWRP